MNRTTVLLTTFCVIAMFLGCTNKTPDASTQKDTPPDKPKTIEAVKPPEVKKGEPIAFKMADYDVKEWKSKSKPTNTSFEVSGDSWYVDWDKERQLFNTIVIHHSATGADATADDIEKIQKFRLYAPRYKSKSDDPFVNEVDGKSLPIHSGHVIDGKERFIGYHHLVYADGKVTTEMSPLAKIDDKWYIDHVGWHAGNWSVNCRSVAICLVGNFSEKEPPDAQLHATAGLVVHYRGFNSKLTVKSHGEITNTECPGKTWRIWREKIAGD